MSKAIVDGIIRSSLNRNVKRFDLVARRYSARNRPHQFRLTEEDFKNTIVKNFSASMSKVINGNPLENPKVKKFLDKVSRRVFQKYASKYVPGSGDTINVYSTYILVYQPRLREKKLKQPIFDIALPLLRRGFSKILTGEKAERFEKGFTRRTQFLHVGKETAGVEALRLLGNTTSGQSVRGEGGGPKSIRASSVDPKTIDKNIDKKLKEAGTAINVSTKQAREAGTNVIIDMLRRLEIEWNSKEKQLSNDYNKNITVFGTVGSSTDNRPGSESFDWINLRAQMEEEIAKSLFNDSEDFANKAASMSPVEKVSRLATNQIIDAVVGSQGKNLKVKTKREKVPKAKRDKSNVGKPNKNNTRLSGGAIAVGALSTQKAGNQATKKNSPPRQSLLELQALLNSKLPDAVRRNMGPPGLTNITGKFASSVRVTDISTTPKGFPSIGYTYDKNPYQVFEVGKGKTPWSTAQRDPRNVIDRSIREIAAERLFGRFFTRRL